MVDSNADSTRRVRPRRGGAQPATGLRHRQRVTRRKGGREREVQRVLGRIGLQTNFRLLAEPTTTLEECWRMSWNPVHIDLLSNFGLCGSCLLYTSPSPRDGLLYRMP